MSDDLYNYIQHHKIINPIILGHSMGKKTGMVFCCNYPDYLYKLIKQIVKNAGREGAVIVSKIREGKDDFGYNAKADKFENLFKTGIIDPTKVTRIALENANSVAGMLLTTECVLADIKEESAPPMPGGGMPMGGGMPGMM